MARNRALGADRWLAAVAALAGIVLALGQLLPGCAGTFGPLPPMVEDPCFTGTWYGESICLDIGDFDPAMVVGSANNALLSERPWSVLTFTFRVVELGRAVGSGNLNLASEEAPGEPFTAEAWVPLLGASCLDRTTLLFSMEYQDASDGYVEVIEDEFLLDRVEECPAL